VRFADFTTITRSRTLPEATDVAAVLYGTARTLYEALGLDRARLRLVGVRVEQLVTSETAPHQLLLGERSRGRREVEQAADRATLRFGTGAVRPATLVGGERPGHPPESPKSLETSTEPPAGGRTSSPAGPTPAPSRTRPTGGRNLPNG
jgi:DNA polymerase-4